MTDDLTYLLTLIRLLKAEGVTEYSNHGLVLKISGDVSSSVCTRSHEVGSREVEIQAPQEAASSSDAETPEKVTIPPKLRGLNPNYFKLSQVTKR